MRLPSLRLAVSLGATVLLAASCGGGTKSGGTGQSFASVTANDLAIMVLPAGRLAGAAEGLAIDPDQSGFSDNKQAAKDTIDPEDDAASLARLGRENGYTLAFYDRDASSLKAKLGIYGISTGVDLMKDAKGAQAYLERQLADYRRLAGTEVDTGVTLTRAEISPLTGPGEGSSLLRASIETNGVTLHATIVAFRLDRLVAAVVLVRADTTDAAAQAEGIAKAFAQRIEDVAAGKVKEMPVPLPAKTGGTTTAPAGAANLAAAALSLDDLPKGVKVAKEGYGAKNGDVLASYSRDFDLGKAKLGGSKLTSLQVEVELYKTEADADGTLLGTGALLGSAAGKKVFATGFKSETGFAPEHLELKLLDRKQVGDGSAYVFASFDTPGGPFDSLFVYFRSGRLLGSLYATAPKGQLHVDDIAPLVETMLSRMASPTAA